MDAVVKLVAQRTGIGEDKARTAVDTVIGFLKERAPGLSGQIEGLLDGGGGAGASAGGVASAVGGMLGKQE